MNCSNESSTTIAKNVLWNALDMVKVNHRPYLLSIVKIGNPMIRLHAKHFEHELKCLKMCLDIANLNPHLCDSNSKSSNNVSSGL